MDETAAPQSPAQPAPPANPADEKSRRRAVKISTVNGWSVAVLGALCLLLSLIWFNGWGILVGAAGALSGFLEITGGRGLREGNPQARFRLPASQLILLAAILLYAAWQLFTFDPKEVTSQFPPDVAEQLSSLLGARNLDAFVQHLARTLYTAVILASVLYQGGLALYYALRTRKLLPKEIPGAGR